METRMFSSQSMVKTSEFIIIFCDKNFLFCPNVHLHVKVLQQKEKFRDLG